MNRNLCPSGTKELAQKHVSLLLLSLIPQPPLAQFSCGEEQWGQSMLFLKQL